jgi:imidazolonepropionase-like amidohydrolase
MFLSGIRFVFLSILLVGPGTATSDLLIRDAILVSAERDEPVHDIDVLVQGGHIQKVAKHIESKAGVEVLDARGLYLMPGLIDSHVHVYHATGLKRRYTPDFEALYDAYLDQAPRSFLYYGYTSVIELNANPRANQRFEKASNHPRLFHCGHGLVLDDGFMALEFGDGGFAKRFPHYLHVPGSNHPTPDGDNPANHTPEQSVASLVEDGASCIKLYYEEALWYPGGPPSFGLPSQALIEEIVRAARVYKVPVLLHATTPSGHRMALRAGVDIAAHGLWEWPGVGYEIEQPPEAVTNVIDEQAAAGFQVQPTMRTIRNTQSMFDDEFLNSPLLDHVLPLAYLEYLRGPAQVQRDMFLKVFGEMIVPGAGPDEIGKRLDTFNTRYERLTKRFSDKGGVLLFGTDTAVGGFGWGAPPGLGGYLEMHGWARAGISLKTIFSAATLGNARAFGLDDQLGTIEAGKRADLLLMTDNPLVDISAYDTIKTVIIGGRLLDRQALSATRSVRK